MKEIKKHEPVLVGTDFKSVAETVQLVKDFCENLNAIQGRWLATFPGQPLTFNGIVGLSHNGHPGAYIKKKYSEENEQFRNLRSMGIKEDKILEMLPFPADYSNLLEVQRNYLRIGGMIQARLALHPTELIGRDEKGMFSLSDAGMEKITEFFSEYTTCEEERIFVEKVHELVNLVNRLNNRGGGLSLNEGPIRRCINHVGTDKPEKSLKKSCGNMIYNIVNYSVNSGVLKTPLADAIISNLKH